MSESDFIDDLILESESTLEEIYDVLINNQNLEEIKVSILERGVSKLDIMSLNDLMDSDKFPMESFTLEPSYINIDVAVESIVKTMIKGLKKIIDIIMKGLKNFFNRLTIKIKDFTERIKEKDEDESIKTRLVVKALQSNAAIVSEDGKSFNNQINGKVASGANTERFLQLVSKDKGGSDYKSVKEVMKIYFRRELSDSSWEDFVKEKDGKLRTLTNSAKNWWEVTHPMVSSHGNISKDFIVKNISIINFTVEKVIYRLNWWLNRIKDISESDENTAKTLLKNLKIQREEEWKYINGEIRNKLADLFKLTSFIEDKIGSDIKESVVRILYSFKKAKVSTTDRIDFVGNLDKMEWMNAADIINESVERASEVVERNEKESNEIIDKIKTGDLKENKFLINQIGDYLREMGKENQVLMLNSTLLLTFLDTIKNNVKDNRRRSADIHFSMVSLGLDIGKHLEG